MNNKIRLLNKIKSDTVRRSALVNGGYMYEGFFLSEMTTAFCDEVDIDMDTPRACEVGEASLTGERGVRRNTELWANQPCNNEPS